jgi:preprotein translocase subunit SecG
MIVLFFNVKLTSGALNGFIFFVQVIDTMQMDADGYISTHDLLDTFTSIYLFTYRMFNLNLFTIDKFSFCLWQGANTLDILAFKYVTILYSIALVVITVLLKKCGKGKYLFCCKKQNLQVQGSESARSSVKSTMIHGLSTFFVMCYFQCAKVTLFILFQGRVHSIGRVHHNTLTPVVFYHGDFKYFGKEHIKYAIPACIFAIALVLIPPLLLVVYPLCYKVLALLHIEETRCVSILCRILPLERMKPMFDSFQSCFKDKYRFFAGLYFFYRLVTLLSYSIADSFTKFYIVLEVQLIVMLTLQAITYPYRRRWHNIIDMLLFANLAVINAMTMCNYKKSKERNIDTRTINAVAAIQTILVLIPFVCVVCFIIIQLVLRVKQSRRSEERCRDERTDAVLALVDYRELEESKSL